MNRFFWSLSGLAALATPARSQVTQLVSVDSNGAQVSADCVQPAVCASGDFVAFCSDSGDLAPGDFNFIMDVFARDRLNGTTVLVSVTSGGTSGDGASSVPALSNFGRHVAFHSFATDLVPGDTNGTVDVFVRDLQTGTTERVSVASNGAEGDAGGGDPAISLDGRYVAFTSFSTNLVPGDTNGVADVFIRDRAQNTTRRVSVDSAGGEANGASESPSISGIGNIVAFTSRATNLVGGDSNGCVDVFVRDRQTGTTERASIASGGSEGNGESDDPQISADGGCVVFRSRATNLAAGDTNGQLDIFLRDRQAGTTERVSIAGNGAQGNGESHTPSTSEDGRFVAFASDASNLVPGDTNGARDAFLRDRSSGTTERLSVSSAGAQANDASYDPSTTYDGRWLVFASYATNLVPEEANPMLDVFLHDRLGGPDYESLCNPGLAGVISCPCANPPAGPPRGCDNSAATGGAALGASGATFVSSDSLVFTTVGETPTALSLVLQGDALVASGAVYGQGVRCVGGVLKRLYTKTASGGSIAAPDFAAGDPTVSTRSQALGSPIAAGRARWYLVYYRDATVLGGCAAASTFNATQTARIGWGF